MSSGSSEGCRACLTCRIANSVCSHRLHCMTDSAPELTPPSVTESAPAQDSKSIAEAATGPTQAQSEASRADSGKGGGVSSGADAKAEKKAALAAKQKARRAW